MGERKRRREAFFANHPKCCFCGGENDAVEIDHQPPRSFFFNRASPQNMRFPSCVVCNRGSKDHDMLFAFWTNAADPTEQYYDKPKMDILLDGLANNHNKFLPKLSTTREKRHFLQDNNLKLSRGGTLSELKLMTVNGDLVDVLNKYFGKLGVALFYKNLGKIVPVGSEILAVHEGNITVKEPLSLKVSDKLHGFEMPNTSSKKSYGQFAYRYGYNYDEDFFVVVMKFNNSIVSTVAIFPRERIKPQIEGFIITKNGFPWD